MRKFLLLITVQQFLFGFSIGSYIINRTVEETNDAKPVINLYYETLCPGCREFTSTQLCPTWEKLEDYFTIEFVPYGNANTTKSETGEITIDCQHGPKECVGNAIQSCALQHLSYVQSTKFICCMEAAPTPDVETFGPKCASSIGIDYAPIKQCSEGPEGTLLHYLNGVKTDKLVPQHQWVPWILFNGKYDKEDMDKATDDFIGVLCKYILDPKPRECNEVV